MQEEEFCQKYVLFQLLKLVAQTFWAIGQIGIKKPELVGHLIEKAFEHLKNKSPKIREKDLFAIGRTGRANIELVENRIDEIIKLHNDENPKVRMSMIWACENIANTKSILFEKYNDIFEKLLDDEDEKYVRAEAPEIFRVIGKYNPDIVKKSLSKLKEKLNDTYKVTQIHSAGAIRIIEKNLKAME